MMNEENIPVVLCDLPESVHGFVTPGSDYEPVIVINSRLPQEIQRMTYRHEMDHITSGQYEDDSYVEYH